MTEEATPREGGLSDGLGQLVPCPLCGANKGYTLGEGSTYRWWRVSCADCGGDLGECRSDGRTHFGDTFPERWEGADEAWNEAGAYANRLRQALAVFVDRDLSFLGGNLWSDSGITREQVLAARELLRA